jgi:hypothetical protein
VQPLQSVNCHDSDDHGHERHEPFTRLVGYGWFGSGRVLGLPIGVSHVSYVWFGYKGETWELCLVLTTWVRHVSRCP